MKFGNSGLYLTELIIDYLPFGTKRVKQKQLYSQRMGLLKRQTKLPVEK
jgi:hypothetical protein